jgi:hypothetical protein
VIQTNSNTDDEDPTLWFRQSRLGFACLAGLHHGQRKLFAVLVYTQHHELGPL